MSIELSVVNASGDLREIELSQDAESKKEVVNLRQLQLFGLQNLFEVYDRTVDIMDIAFSTITNYEALSIFKDIQLYGDFDNTKQYKIGYLRSDIADNHRRIIIDEWSGSAWVKVYDESMSVNSSSNWDASEGNFRMKALIDWTAIPDNTWGFLWGAEANEPSVVINKKAFRTDYDQDLNTTDDVEFNSLTVNSDLDANNNKIINLTDATTKQDSVNLRQLQLFGLQNLFEVYDTSIDIMDIAFDTVTNYQVLSAFKDIQLYGDFDNTKQYKIGYIRHNVSGNQTSIIIDEWSGSAWVRVYYGNDTVTSHFDDTDGDYRVKALMDWSKIPNNTLGYLWGAEANEPAVVINKSAFKTDQELNTTDDVEFNSLTIAGELTTPFNVQIYSANKNYYTSRRKPTIVWIWDDLNDTDALVYSIFQEFGFTPNFALIAPRLTGSKIKEYQDYYMNGCSILAHSMTHPEMDADAVAAGLTAEEVDDEMYESKRDIEANGIKVSGWVTPYNTLDPSFRELMIKNFGYGYTKRGGEFNQTVDPVDLSRYAFADDMSGGDIHNVTNRIDTAIANNELLSIYSHTIPSATVTETDLRNILTHLKTKTDANLCQVLSADEAMFQYYQDKAIQQYEQPTIVNTATYELISFDRKLNVTYTATGLCTITIPTALITTEMNVMIKDAGGNSSIYNIIIETEGAETIDGQSNLVINSDYGAVNLYSDGSNLFIY